VDLTNLAVQQGMDPACRRGSFAPFRLILAMSLLAPRADLKAIRQATKSDRDMMKYYGILEHDGWTGVFTTRQSPMAKIANGARIKKAAMEEGDAHAIGAMGTVLGSLGAPELGVAYFVEFDDRPRHAALIVERKIAAIPAE
jgi:hypothetical protein